MDMKKIIIICLLIFPVIILAQFEVKGTVLDDNGAPLPGVSVTESMTNNSVVTDFDGNFTIQVGSEGVTLNISSVGFNENGLLSICLLCLYFNLEAE